MYLFRKIKHFSTQLTHHWQLLHLIFALIKSFILGISWEAVASCANNCHLIWHRKLFWRNRIFVTQNLIFILFINNLNVAFDGKLISILQMGWQKSCCLQYKTLFVGRFFSTNFVINQYLGQKKKSVQFSRFKMPQGNSKHFVSNFQLST